MAVTTSRPLAAGARHTDDAPGLLYIQAHGYPRPALAERLLRLGMPATVAADAAEALRLLAERRFRPVLVDLASDRAAITTIRLLRARHADLPIVGIVEPANAIAAAEALQAGIVDLLPWPFETADLAAIVAHHRDRASSHDPAARSERDPGFGWFLDGPAMRAVRETVIAAAAVRHGVAVCGESGSGHDVVAQAIHALAGDAADAFIRLRCGQSSDDIERQLFGNVTDPHDARSAVVLERVSEDAAIRRGSHGTIFIERLVEAPTRVQARLARLLRDREGIDDGGRPLALEVRIVAALDGSVAAAVADGRLRRDLADRLVTHVDLLSLRGRSDDIPRLAAYYLREACQRHGLPARHFSRAALTLLAALPWPRNLEDLAALAETAACGARGLVVHLEDVLTHAHLDTLTPRVDAMMTLREARRHFERECITAALMRHHGRVGEAARALGIQRTNLYRKVSQLKVDKALLSPRRP
jgi:two-component system response regulator GlrR